MKEYAMKPRVIAFAAAVVLGLIGQSIDIAGMKAMLVGGAVPAPQEVRPSLHEFSVPDSRGTLAVAVMAPGQSTCDGVAQILRGRRAARAPSLSNTLARCG
jgi:hypothetical protein